MKRVIKLVIWKDSVYCIIAGLALGRIGIDYNKWLQISDGHLMIRAFRLMTNLQEIRNQGRRSQTPLLCRSIAPKILQERFISLV